MGAVCGIVSNMNPATTTYHQMLDDLNSYLQDIKFPAEKGVAVRTYLLHCKQLFRSRFYQKVLYNLSPALQGQIAGHCHGVWIKNVWFFAKAGEAEQNAFVTEVTLALEPEVFTPNELVVREGQRARKLYIVQRGVVAGAGRVMGAGKCFGEDMIMQQGFCLFDVRALSFLDVYGLSSSALQQIIARGGFPQTQRAIRKAANRMALHRYMLKLALIARMSHWFTPMVKGEAEERKARLIELGSHTPPPLQRRLVAGVKSVIATNMLAATAAAAVGSGAAAAVQAAAATTKGAAAASSAATAAAAAAERARIVDSFAARHGKAAASEDAVAAAREEREKLFANVVADDHLAVAEVLRRPLGNGEDMLNPMNAALDDAAHHDADHAAGDDAARRRALRRLFHEAEEQRDIAELAIAKLQEQVRAARYATTEDVLAVSLRCCCCCCCCCFLLAPLGLLARRPSLLIDDLPLPLPPASASDAVVTESAQCGATRCRWWWWWWWWRWSQQWGRPGAALRRGCAPPPRSVAARSICCFRRGAGSDKHWR